MEGALIHGGQTVPLRLSGELFALDESFPDSIAIRFDLRMQYLTRGGNAPARRIVAIHTKSLYENRLLEILRTAGRLNPLDESGLFIARGGRSLPCSQDYCSNACQVAGPTTPSSANCTLL